MAQDGREENRHKAQTTAAVGRVRDVQRIGGLSNKDNWIAFVSEISSAAFTRAEARRALVASIGMV